MVRLLRSAVRMKHTAIFALALAVAACSHNERAAEPSAASVDQATTTPSDTDFTPPQNRVDDTTTALETPSGTADGPATGPGSTTALTPASGATTGSGTTTTPMNPTGAVDTNRPTGTQADNTKVNQRDRDNSALTPMDQSESEGDRKITQQIRQAVMKDGSLSFSAKNVKIITIGGKVTLRGPVKSAEERSAIANAATQVAGAGRVDNQLEIAK